MGKPSEQLAQIVGMIREKQPSLANELKRIAGECAEEEKTSAFRLKKFYLATRDMHNSENPHEIRRRIMDHYNDVVNNS